MRVEHTAATTSSLPMQPAITAALPGLPAGAAGDAVPHAGAAAGEAGLLRVDALQPPQAITECVVCWFGAAR